LERLISGHERDGSMKFQDFVKVLTLYHEGDLRFTFGEEIIEQVKSTVNVFDDTPMVSSSVLLDLQ
jgi:hypothetical protein